MHWIIKTRQKENTIRTIKINVKTGNSITRESGEVRTNHDYVYHDSTIKWINLYEKIIQRKESMKK